VTLDEEAYPVKLDKATDPVTLEKEAYPVKLDKADDPVTLEDETYPVSLDKANDPVTLDDEAYPVKLDELWFQGRVDVVNLTGLLTSERFCVWWEGGPLLVKDHVGVTNVCANPK